MELYLLVAAAILGAIAGSFINALSYRFNTGRGMGGRSYCDTCSATLGALDLVPIFSYLFLRGRCRHCGSKIAIQNLLVELAAAFISVLIYLLHPFITEPAHLLQFFFWFLVWMVLLFTVVYDLKHSIIPLQCSIILGLFALISLFVGFDPSLHLELPDIWSLLAGPLLALPLFLISLVSRGRWMGWGDSGLELSLGWFLGLSVGFSALMLAFWSGALMGILLIALKKGLTMKSELPFAPFLVFGAFIAYFFHVDFFTTFPLTF
jgi:leader peptidase (prepilin peptidase) / N-methyltransferase